MTTQTAPLTFSPTPTPLSNIDPVEPGEILICITPTGATSKSKPHPNFYHVEIWQAHAIEDDKENTGPRLLAEREPGCYVRFTKTASWGFQSHIAARQYVTDHPRLFHRYITEPPPGIQITAAGLLLRELRK